MDFSARATTKDAARSRRRRSCTPPRSSSTLPVTPWEFSVEGESGSESDERIGAGPRWASDRGGGEGDAAAVHGGVQTEERPGGRWLQDAGHGWGLAAAGGAVLLAPDDLARGAGARGTGRGAKEAWARASGRGSARQEARRARARAQPVEEARRAG